MIQAGGEWMGSAAGKACDTSGAITGTINTFCLSYTNY